MLTDLNICFLCFARASSGHLPPIRADKTECAKDVARSPPHVTSFAERVSELRVGGCACARICKSKNALEKLVGSKHAKPNPTVTMKRVLAQCGWRSRRSTTISNQLSAGVAARCGCADATWRPEHRPPGASRRHHRRWPCPPCHAFRRLRPERRCAKRPYWLLRRRQVPHAA